jgi:peptidoglycan/LPS O-acetylase OafA/YrhL
LTHQDTTRSPGLDLLRSLAILLVITWHIPQSYYPFGVKPPGWIGVDLFFVLSGYLIGSQLLRPYTQNRHISFATFYARRALRIFPAYIVVVVIYFTIHSFREQPNIAPLWRFLTFTQNFGLNSLATGAFSNAWSLCVEEHFYLVLPLVVVWLMKKPTVFKTLLFSVTVLVFGVLLRGFLWIHYVKPLSALEEKIVLPVYLEKIYYPTYARLDGLLVGVLLAAISLFRPDWWRRIRSNQSLLLLMGLTSLALAVWICRDMHSFSTAVIGFPLLALSFGLLLTCGLSWNKIPFQRGANAGAVLAYSIYLTHKPIMHLDHQYVSNFVHNRILSFLTYPVSILAAAAILHLCIERPFLKLRSRIVEMPLRIRVSVTTPQRKSGQIFPAGSDTAAFVGD